MNLYHKNFWMDFLGRIGAPIFAATLVGCLYRNKSLISIACCCSLELHLWVSAIGMNTIRQKNNSRRSSEGFP